MKKLAVVVAIAMLSGCVIAPNRHHNNDHDRDHHRHHHYDQYAQSAHRAPAGCTQLQDANGTCHKPAVSAYHPKGMTPIHVSKFGVDFKRSTDGFAYINGHAAAVDEQSESAMTYQGGTYQVIVRQSGRIDLMNNGQFVGHMK